MITRYPNRFKCKELPVMRVTDGETTWNWECACGHKHFETDALGAGDMLTCDECGLQYRCQ